MGLTVFLHAFEEDDHHTLELYVDLHRSPSSISPLNDIGSTRVSN